MPESNSICCLQSKTSLSSDDLLVMSQQDKYVSGKYNSCSIKGGTLIDMLMQSVLSMQNFSSTAHMLSTSFSPYEHNHDRLYNKLSLDFAYMSQDTYHKMSQSWLSSSFKNAQLMPNDKSLSVGNVFIDGTLVPVDVALSAIRQIQKISFGLVEPSIGSLKFVPTTSIRSNSSINYRSNDFDGWLYPDGSTFELRDFALSSQLRDLYGSRYSSSFTLPDLRKFMKLNGNNQYAGSSMLGVVPGQNVLKRHYHSLNGSVNVTASIIAQFIAGAPNEGVAGSTSELGGIFNIAGRADLMYTGDRLPHLHSNGNVVFGSLYQLYWSIFHQTSIDYYPFPYTKGDWTSISLCRTGMYQLLLSLQGFNGSTASKSGKKYTIATNDCVGVFDYISTIPLVSPSYLSLNATANVGGNTSVTLQQVYGNMGETYPAHIILPVMIYVGQNRRAYYE